MQTLPVSFTKYGADYNQIERTKRTSIFQVSKHGRTQCFDAVRIQIHAAHTWPNGETSPEREAMPPSESWGAEAFTCRDFPSAQRRAAELEGTS